MILHLGAEMVAAEKDIIMIMDAGCARACRATREYIKKASERGELIDPGEGTKSYVITRAKNGKNALYASPISSSTLYKRCMGEGEGTSA